MEQSPFRKRIVTYLIKKFPAFHRTWKFITVFTRARHWTLHRAGRIQSAPSKSSFRIYFIPLRLSLPTCPFPSGFPTELLQSFLISLMPRQTLYIYKMFSVRDILRLLGISDKFYCRNVNIFNRNWN